MGVIKREQLILLPLCQILRVNEAPRSVLSEINQPFAGVALSSTLYLREARDLFLFYQWRHCRVEALMLADDCHIPTHLAAPGAPVLAAGLISIWE